MRRSNTVNYYESVRKSVGAAKSANSVRLFMFPGMAHCGGGEGPNRFDSTRMAWWTGPDRFAPTLRWPPTREAAARMMRRPSFAKRRKACNTTAALARFGDIIAPISGGRNADRMRYRLNSHFPCSCSPELCPTRRRAHGRRVSWPRYFFFRIFFSSGSYGRRSPKVCWSRLLPAGRC